MLTRFDNQLLQIQNRGNQQLSMIENQQTRKTKVLIIGIIGVFLIYWTSALIHQKLINGTFLNSRTSRMETFQNRDGLIIFPCLAAWITGEALNSRLPHRVKIPIKNSFICAFIIFISTFSYTIAAAKTSFPVVMTFKASNVLSVLLVAVFFTRVREKSLNLPPKKLITGIVITIGAFMFGFFDPQVKQRTTDSELIGIGLLLVSLIADGLLPDFQAVIKAEYKPEPTQMMSQINKWVAIISTVYALISFEIWQILVFMIFHPGFTLNLLAMSSFSVLGQIIIYRFIKEFKQHIVPFVVTIRKIFTVLINVIVFGHKTQLLQFIGMSIVVGAVILQFYNELHQSQKSYSKVNQDTLQIEEEQMFNLGHPQEKLK